MRNLSSIFQLACLGPHTKPFLDCRTSAVMALFCIRPVDALSTDSKRAELLRWLIDSHHAIDLSAVNARLQTPVHCALETHSMEVLEVRAPWLASYCCNTRHSSHHLAASVNGGQRDDSPVD